MRYAMRIIGLNAGSMRVLGAYRLWQAPYVGGLPGTGVGTACVALTR